MKLITKFDHPDLVGGVVWSDCELDWINERLAKEVECAETGWAQAQRLALELECLLLATGNTPGGAKWWDSGHEALEEYRKEEDVWFPQDYVSGFGKD